MNKKYISIILILSVLCVSLTGCYDVRGIETLSYAIALGLDEGDTNLLKLTIQFANPSAIGSNGSGGSSSQSNSSTLTTVECSSIESGINLINSYISKQVNLAHCKILVISETLANKGISNYLYTFTNNVEIRPDCNIIISRCSANDFLNNAKPTLETLSARYYEVALTSSEYTGFTENITLAQFYSDYKDSCSQAVAILGGVNSESTHIHNYNDISAMDSDGIYKAGQTPIKDQTSLEAMGLAVFKEDKLVGELNGIETICHLIVTNDLDRCNVTIPSPFYSSDIISLSLSRRRNTNCKLSFVNGSPFIKIDVHLNANVISSPGISDLSNQENINKVKEAANNYIKDRLYTFLYKTTQEYNSDICGFGKYAVSKYLSTDDWSKSDWNSNYKNAVFEVNVETDIKSGYLYIKN